MMHLILKLQYLVYQSFYIIGKKVLVLVGDGDFMCLGKRFRGGRKSESR